MKTTRREFFGRLAASSPLLTLLGIRIHVYANPLATGWHGWVTWCGRLVGFVRLNGRFCPFP